MGSEETDSEFSDHHNDHEKSKRKKFLRRFSSLKEVRKTLFSGSNRQLGGEEEEAITSSSHQRESSQDRLSRAHQKVMKKYNKAKGKSSSKTAVEIIKEGACSYVGGREIDGKKWEKCRLSLVKTIGGYMLEFYSPPKVANQQQVFV